MCPSCAGVRQEPDSTVCLSFCAPGLGNACMACSPGTEGVDGQATRWCNIGGARCVIRRTMPSLQRHAQSVVPRVVRGVGRYSVPVKRAPKVPPPSPAATPSNAIPVCAHPDAFRPHRPSLLLASDSVSPRTLPLAPAGATIRWIQGRRERHHAMEFRAGGQRHHAMEFRAGGQRHHASDSGQEGSAAMQWIQGGSAPAHAQHLQACPGWLRHSPTHMPPHTHTHTHTPCPPLSCFSNGSQHARSFQEIRPASGLTSVGSETTHSLSTLCAQPQRPPCCWHQGTTTMHPTLRRTTPYTLPCTLHQAHHTHRAAPAPSALHRLLALT